MDKMKLLAHQHLSSKPQVLCGLNPENQTAILVTHVHIANVGTGPAHPCLSVGTSLRASHVIYFNSQWPVEPGAWLDWYGPLVLSMHEGHPMKLFGHGHGEGDLDVMVEGRETTKEPM
jgi:hypothetical protein